MSACGTSESANVDTNATGTESAETEPAETDTLEGGERDEVLEDPSGRAVP